MAGKHFAWERPLSKADIKRFGDQPIPQGLILATKVDDFDDKEAALQAHLDSFFDIAHFKQYPAVLIALETATATEVREAITDGWLATAPPATAQDFVDRDS